MTSIASTRRHAITSGSSNLCKCRSATPCRLRNAARATTGSGRDDRYSARSSRPARSAGARRPVPRPLARGSSRSRCRRRGRRGSWPAKYPLPPATVPKVPDLTGLTSDKIRSIEHGFTQEIQEKPRYPVRVGAGFFWVSGVDGLVVNRAEHPLQHAMRAPSSQLCSVTGVGPIGDFREVLPFQHNASS
jgi:hypothetical protein